MAPGTSADAVKWWTDTLKMVTTPEWQAEAKKVGIEEPIYMFGNKSPSSSTRMPKNPVLSSRSSAS